MKRGHRRVRGALVRAALLSASWLSACESEERLSIVGPEIFGEPAIGTPLVFEEVVLDRTRPSSQVLRIGNRGQGILTVNDVRLEGTSADHFRLGLRPRAVAPGQFGTLDIEFTPTETAAHEAQLIIASNDVRRPRAVWPQQGNARNPCSIEA
ncbi:MAG: hypothetical protein AAF449_09975 [Myxococcota bacterium]